MVKVLFVILLILPASLLIMCSLGKLLISKKYRRNLLKLGNMRLIIRFWLIKLLTSRRKEMAYPLPSTKSSLCIKASLLRWNPKMMNASRNLRRNGMRKSRSLSRTRRKKQDISNLKGNFLKKELMPCRLRLKP